MSLTRSTVPFLTMTVSTVLLVTLSLLNGASAAVTVKNCFPNITEPNVPLLHLGGVEHGGRACDSAISPRLHRCHTEYVDSVKQTFVAAKCYDGAESVRRAMCCSLWTAKQCMVEAAEATTECASNVTAQYRTLPTREERDHVLDQCSEYGESVAACDPVQLSDQGSFLRTFVIVLFVFLSLPAIVYGAIKLHELYLDYKSYQSEEAARKAQQSNPNTDDYSDYDALALSEKQQQFAEDDHEDDDEHNDDLKA